MVRIGKCNCGGELVISSYSGPRANAMCRKCLLEYPCIMKGTDRFYRRDKTSHTDSCRNHLCNYCYTCLLCEGCECQP